MTETDTETIAVADVSEGPGGDAGTDPGTPVSLPVVELLTGRGFVTGKSGSGKSNTASVLVENLLSNNFPVLVVDTDGEYYGLKEEFELLHAGADEECDIQVSPEHAEKLASLALEGNVPIILDVSGYLDDEEAKDLLLAVARQLFAKEKKLKKPFLMLVEEVHEYIPEGGGLDETGKMLIKIGKRGRKHGLGIVGISQRPADVKKDYITQCDWLVWHRLTWNNDTQVVKRIIDAEHASAVEDLDDGEAFLMTDWSETVRRVQFHRKRTFDAGATPGLGDFERPELKSVSGDLVEDLREISDEQERRESELADLRQEVEKKERRIEQLERELSEARDLSRMADQFAQAMLQKADAPYRGGDGANASREAALAAAQAELHDYERDAGDGADATDGVDGGADAAEQADVTFGADASELGGSSAWPDPLADAATDATATDETTPAEESAAASDAPATESATTDAGETTDSTAVEETGTPASDDGADATRPDATATPDVTPTSDATPEDGSPSAGSRRATPGTREAVVDGLRADVESLPDISRRMLAHYRAEGAADPVDAHVAAGGTPEQPMAYGRNRPLRTAGFVRHVEGGRYEYALPDRVSAAFDGHLDGEAFEETVRAVERAFVDESVLDAEAADVRADDEREEVEVVDNEEIEADDGFVDEDAVFVEEDDRTGVVADDATRRQMESGGGDPRSPSDAEIL